MTSKNNSKKDWRHLEYYVPVTESLKNDDGTVTIKGIAINECTTRNGITYTATELMPAANSLKNRPILKDHNNSVDAIVGRTTNSGWDMLNKNVTFEGKIMDQEMCDKINMGLINNVSIGAMVQRINKNDDGMMVAEGIQFVEISLVAVPADPNAGFAKAIAESYQIMEESENEKLIQECSKETQKVSEEKTVKEKTDLIIGGEKMDEDKTIKLEEQSRVLAEQNEKLSKQLEEFQTKEMNALRDSYKNLAAEKGVSAKEGYEKLSKEVLEALIDTLKQFAKPIIAEAKKDETKGVVVEKTEQSTLNYKFEKSNVGRGVSFYNPSLAEKHSRYSRN